MKKRGILWNQKKNFCPLYTQSFPLQNGVFNLFKNNEFHDPPGYQVKKINKWIDSVGYKNEKKFFSVNKNVTKEKKTLSDSFFYKNGDHYTMAALHNAMKCDYIDNNYI